jgi:hypothetical protein
MATNTAWQSSASTGTLEVQEMKYADLTCDQKSLFNKSKSALVRVLDEPYYHMLRLGSGNEKSLEQFVNFMIVNDTEKAKTLCSGVKADELAQYLADNAGKLIKKIKLGKAGRHIYEGHQLKIVKGGRGSCKKTTSACEVKTPCEQKSPCASTRKPSCRRKSSARSYGGRTITVLSRSSRRRSARRTRKSCNTGCDM